MGGVMNLYFRKYAAHPVPIFGEFPARKKGNASVFEREYCGWKDANTKEEDLKYIWHAGTPRGQKVLRWKGRKILSGLF